MPGRSVPFAVLSAALLLSSASAARAHITMISPDPRTAQQKEGPCGATGSVRGETVAVYRPGETITVMWEETIDHESHYRIAFDADGDDDFVSPAGRDDLYNSPTVLVDAIGDAVGGRYTQEVTLPDVECESCTLQLIQVMYGSGNYFQCADIALRRDPGDPAPEPDAGPAPVGGADAGSPVAPEDAGAPAERDAGAPPGPTAPDASTPPSGTPSASPSSATIHGGCSTSGGGGTGAWLLVLLAYFCTRRRLA